MRANSKRPVGPATTPCNNRRLSPPRTRSRPAGVVSFGESIGDGSAAAFWSERPIAVCHVPNSGAALVRPIFRQLLLGALALATIDLAAGGINPVFRGQEPLGERIFARAGWRDIVSANAPWIHADSAAAIESPQFDADRAAFAEDLMRTGAVTEVRADSLADAAVREAYVRRVPPALVLGVMLTENDELKSSARSRVGAVGLMQVHGRSWRNALGRMFGTNLRNDTTNLRYGVYILSYMAHRAAEKASEDSISDETFASDSSWRTALLHYNGCVRGKNTPDCRSYPVTVKRNVIDNAKATCGGRDFDACVAKPLWLSTRSER